MTTQRPLAPMSMSKPFQRRSTAQRAAAAAHSRRGRGSSSSTHHHSMPSPWHELGLAPGASENEIKHAYRKLVLEFHPDRHASSSSAAQEAAAARFKVITEAYNTLTDDRARSAYEASSSSSRGRPGRAYHANVNTDWTHYNSQAGAGYDSGYTSRMSRWELYRRIAKQNYRAFSQTLHLSLAVLLVGGGLLFESSYNAAWQARNKGKSFEEVQQLVKAQRESKASSLSSGSSSGDGGGSSAVNSSSGGSGDTGGGSGGSEAGPPQQQSQVLQLS